MKLEKLQNIVEKGKALVSKIGKKTVIVSASVAVIGIAVLLNFILLGNGEKKDGLKPGVDLSDLTAGDEGDAGDKGDSGSNDAMAEENYFATMVLSRQQARDEAIEVLQSVVDSKEAIADMKTDAMEDMRKIASEIEMEANIETLVLSKGFEQCVAVVNGDSASVVVKTDGLLPSHVSQISEIVYEQAGILPVNLNIIEKK